MAKISKATKKSYLAVWIIRLIEFILLFLPITIYVVMAILDKGIDDLKKIVILSTVAIVLILGLFNIIAQKHLRSPLWILFLGLYLAVDNLIPLIIINAIALILDEFIVAPLLKYYKSKTVANKAIDDRLQDLYSSQSHEDVGE